MFLSANLSIEKHKKQFELFDAVVKGDEELVKVLLLENKTNNSNLI